MSVVTPIGSVRRRLPQAGRIRLGEKGGAQGRRALNTFRFTSQDRDLLLPVAQLYGGEVKPWKDAKSGDTFELRSTATKINVVLPPDPLTEAYEMWSGKTGLERRCDGEICSLRAGGGPDGPEVRDVPCVCEQRGVLECKYKLRLNVILPEVESLGTWRLDTSSEHARQEIPGVVEVIENLQGRGMTTAVLRLEQRTSPGHRFNVPVLDPGVSIEALSAGAARLAAPLGPPTAPPHALSAGESEAAGVANPPAAPSPDDDIIEAEVVEEVDPTIARAWLDNLPVKRKAQALLRAREIADDLNEPIPTGLAAVTPRVLNQLCEEMAP